MLHNFVEINNLKKSYSRRSINYDRHDCFEIIWVEKVDAEAYNIVDNEKIKVKANEFILIAKNQYHEMKGKHEGTSICFKGEFFRKGNFTNLRVLFSPFKNIPYPNTDSETSFVKAYIKLFKHEIKNSNFEPILVSLLVGLLNKIYLLNPMEGARDARSLRLESLFDLVEENYTKEKGTSFYAKQIGLTPKRVNEILKQRTGYTLTQIINNIVILEAKRRLILVDKNINDISYELGFKEQAYFSRYFKRGTGMTPSEYIDYTNSRK